MAGAGLMGHGIAQVHRGRRAERDLYEPELARAEAGRARIVGNLERAVAKGRLDATAAREIADRIAATDRVAAVAEADLVVEAVFEDEAVKRALWARARRAGAGARHLRLEHQLHLHRPARGGAGAGPAAGVLRDALLQPRAGHAARGADPGRRDGRRDGSGGPRAGGGPRQAGDRLAPIGPGSSSTGSSCPSWPRRCARSRRGSGRRRTSTRVRASGSTTRWARWRWPTSSASTWCLGVMRGPPGGPR